MVHEIFCHPTPAAKAYRSGHSFAGVEFQVRSSISCKLRKIPPLPGAMAFESILDDTALVPDRALANATRHYWRVGAVDGDSVVTFGSHATFTTGPSPSSQPVRIPDSRKDEVTVACAVLYNHGVLPITIDSLSHHSRLFTGTLLPAVVAPGDSAVVQYNYHPRRFGAEADTLTLYTDEGHCPVLLNAQCSPPVLQSMQSQVTLGPVAIDDSAAVSVVFVNSGRFNKLTVRKVWTRTHFFSASFLPLRVIEPGDTLRVPIRFHLRAFRPDAFGKYVDTCFVESDGGQGKVVLNGDSPSPRLWLEPQMLSFGDVAAHDTAFATLRLMNRSVNTARVDSVRNRNRNFRPMAGRMNVRAADTMSLTLRYTPTRFGTHGGYAGAVQQLLVGAGEGAMSSALHHSRCWRPVLGMWTLKLFPGGTR